MSSPDADYLIVRPAEITDEVLTSTTVPEAPPAAYVAETTYAAGARVSSGSAGGVIAVWESLQDSNTGNALEEGDWWTHVGDTYAEWTAGTYGEGDRFLKVSTHLIYESLQDANDEEPGSSDKWMTVQATNAWACFDKIVNRQTAAPNQIVMVLTPGQTVSTVGLLNVSAASITVEQSDSGFSETQAMQTHNVNNWYNWYYEPPIRKTDTIFTVPPYPASSLTITVDSAGDTAAIGELVVGLSRRLGATQWGLTGEVISYSTSTTDTFGNITMIRRNRAKRLQTEVRIDKGFEDEVYRILAEYTDTETLFIASRLYSMTILYGFLGQWSVPITSDYKPASIELRSLT